MLWLLNKPTGSSVWLSGKHEQSVTNTGTQGEDLFNCTLHTEKTQWSTKLQWLLGSLKQNFKTIYLRFYRSHTFNPSHIKKHASCNITLTPGNSRISEAMVQDAWCFRNQKPWTKPTTGCIEYLPIKLFGGRKIHTAWHTVGQAAQSCVEAWGLCRRPWSCCGQRVLIPMAHVATKDDADIPGLCLKPCWCLWATLPPKIAFVWVACVASWGCIEVHDPCCPRGHDKACGPAVARDVARDGANVSRSYHHQKPSGYLWSVLPTEAMLISMGWATIWNTIWVFMAHVAQEAM